MSRFFDSVNETQLISDLFADKFSKIYEGNSETFNIKSHKEFVEPYAELLSKG